MNRFKKKTYFGSLPKNARTAIASLTKTLRILKNHPKYGDLDKEFLNTISSFFEEFSHSEKYKDIIFNTNYDVKFYILLFRIIGRPEKFWNNDSDKLTNSQRLEHLKIVLKDSKKLLKSIESLNDTDRSSLYGRYAPSGQISINILKSINNLNKTISDLKTGQRNWPILRMTGAFVFRDVYPSSRSFKKNKIKNSFTTFTTRELITLFKIYKVSLYSSVILNILDILFEDNAISQTTISKIKSDLKNMPIGRKK